MGSISNDLRFSLKLLWKEKAFTITALLTLALTIGANAAIFAVINSVLLRPLPMAEADRIFYLYNRYPGAGADRAATSVPQYLDRVGEIDAFEEQALYNFRSKNIQLNGEPQRVRSMQATPSFFRLIGVQPFIGRSFSDDEAELGNEQKVILSYGLWQSLYGGDRGVLGRELRVDDRPYEIIGVMPRGFVYVEPGIDLWVPATFTERDKALYSRHNNSWEMIARLDPGVSAEVAQQQIDALNGREIERFPEFKELVEGAGFHTRVVNLQEDLVKDVKGTLFLLWGGVAFVLLIGAVNVANLMLVRTSARLKELALRVSIGASRQRLTLQLITESVVLSVFGGAFGLLAGYWGLKVIRGLGLEQLPRGTEVQLDAVVVLFTVAIAVVVGVVLGLIPVAHLFGLDLNAVLREEGRGGTSGPVARRVRQILAIAQVAFAFVLLAGSGLLLASFRELLSVDLGFEEEGLLTAAISAPPSRYGDDDALRSLVDRSLERIRAIPGVEAAGASFSIPFGDNYSASFLMAEGYVMGSDESLVSPNEVIVTPGYLEALGIERVAGRFFDSRDGADAPLAVIVDRSLADKFWPGQDPIGKRMYIPTNPDDPYDPGPEELRRTVVGVVKDSILKGLTTTDTSAGTYYYPYAQHPRSDFFFAVRATEASPDLPNAIRRAMSSVDPQLPLYDVQPMAERIDDSLTVRRTPLLLAIVFSVVALFLAAVGLYGLLSYLVANRRREIGIRMALGSDAPRIVRLVLREGMKIFATGMVFGLISALALSRTLQTQLYGVAATDPRVLAVVIAVLLLVSLGASIIPALRAARTDPATVLQS